MQQRPQQGRKRVKRKLRYLPGWTSTFKTNRRRLNRKDRHSTRKELRP